jgi:mannose-1-phosphate guanylyltransferase
MKALLLSAGIGSRLGPITGLWPKCLMPIHGRPLLEYWLSDLSKSSVSKIFVNLHHLKETVQKFLERDCFSGMVETFVEEELLGTAGTIRALSEELSTSTTIIAHADNWVDINFRELISHHSVLCSNHPGYLMTMVTFDTENPTESGIVESDDTGFVTAFYEKIANPPGTRANGAVYIVEPDLIQWICNRPNISDFSTEVIPEHLGLIGTYHNERVHRDIGRIESLRKAQSDPRRYSNFDVNDAWSEWFRNHRVMELIHRNAKET